MECFGRTIQGDEECVNFSHFDIALVQFNVNEKQRSKLYQLIAGILHMNLIKLEETNNIASVCASASSNLRNSSDLLSINSSELIEALTVKIVEAGNDDKVR